MSIIVLEDNERLKLQEGIFLGAFLRENFMNVVMVSDDNYAFLLISALWSLFKNNKDEQIKAYIISDHISRGNIEKLMTIAANEGHDVNVIDAPHMDDINILGNYNISTFFRLKMASLLPKDVKRVLYLDCDILIRNSIKDFYNINMGNSIIAGVWDTSYADTRYAVGLTDDDVYINAGVILIDLNKWREHRIEERCFEYIKEQNTGVYYNDQGIINHACRGKIKVVSPKYNMIWPYMGLEYRMIKKRVHSKYFYNEGEIHSASNNPVIVHFAGEIYLRPWYKYSIAPYTDEFDLNCLELGLTMKNEETGSLMIRINRWACGLKKPINGYALHVIYRLYRIKQKLICLLKGIY